MLVFENPGLADMRALTTLGVNVKDGSAPIGQFGTGFKAAVAIVLRLGGSVEVWRGRKLHVFGVKKADIRKKEFGIVTLDGRELGFTTDYAGHWEPWMAYRELWSNARDEGGSVRRVDEMPEVGPKRTLIVVRCPELERAHDERHKIILQTEPLVVVPGLEIHAGVSEHVYYRGIRVATVPGKKKSLYTYNLTDTQQLTEDRTLAYQWMLGGTVARGLVQCTNAAVLSTILSSEENKDMWEEVLPFSEVKAQKPSPQFMEVAEQLQTLRRLSAGVGKLFNDYRDTMPGYVSPYIVQPTAMEEETIARAIDLLKLRTGLVATRIDLRFKTQISGFSKVQATEHGGMVIERSVLTAGSEQLAIVLLEGLAQMAGGSVVAQLCSRAVTGRWLPSERHRPIGSPAEPEVPF